MNLLEKAMSLATRAHAGQFRRDGKTPYIKHPEAVAKLVKDRGGDEELQAVAWLHDVVEDTSFTLEDLAALFPASVVSAVAALTHLAGESNNDYWLKVSLCPMAKIVKLADIATNLGDNPTDHQRKKYGAALSFFFSCRGIGN